MKQILCLVVVLVVLFACQHPAPRFVPAHDTVVVAYRTLKKGPTQLYIGTYTTYQKKVYADSPSLNVSYTTGYNWRVKVNDTTPDGHGHSLLDTLHHPIPQWFSVPDSLTPYIQIITVGS